VACAIKGYINFSIVIISLKIEEGQNVMEWYFGFFLTVFSYVGEFKFILTVAVLKLF